MNKRMRYNKTVLIAFLVLILCIAVFIIFITSNNPQPASSFSDTVLNVTVIDVGQGDSILLTFGSETMLIDAAEKHESEAVLEELKARCIDDIDILVATHPHDDHIGGIEAVIDKYSVDKVYMADTASKSKTYKGLVNSLKTKGIPIYVAYAGLEFSLGQVLCTIISPGRQDDYDANNESVAVFVDFINSEFLFTGDIEQKAEDELISSRYYIDADVLKVAHHGSSTGTSEAFLKAVSPDYAAISCGKGNTYKHPHKETLELLSNLGIKTYRTDISGDITFVSDGQNINVVTENSPAQ